MQYLKYFILGLFLLDIPSFILLALKLDTLASVVSYLEFILMFFYYMVNSKFKLALPFVLIGITYYLLAFLHSTLDLNSYFLEATKYFIIIICGNELVKRCSVLEIYWFLIIGGVSIFIQPLLFSDNYGRASGFYLNPNIAGFISIIGYCLTYAVPGKFLKLFGQLLFSFVGLLTFSRTFILIWVIVNIASLWISFKNIRVFFIGAVVVFSIVAFSQTFITDSIRFNQLEDVLNNKSNLSEINEDSRTDTWAQYYFLILENPVFGNGLGALRSDDTKFKQGVHNSYLLIWGEAGILPFIIFTGLFCSLMYTGLKYFKEEPYLFLFVFSISLYLLTSHNYFNDYTILLFSLWIYNKLLLKSKIDKTQLALNA